MMNANYYKTALNTIYEISVILNSSNMIQHSLYRSLLQMSDTLSMERGLILLHDKDTNELFVEASIGLDNDEGPVKNMRYKADEGVVGKVFKYGIPILIPDVQKEPMFLNKLGRNAKKEEISFIAVPIKHQNQTYGVLAVDKVVSKMYSITTDVDILKMIATLMASFLHKVQFFTSEMEAIQQEKSRIEEEKLKLIGEVTQKYQYEGLVGSGRLMRKVLDKVQMVTASDSAVLIRGESGTGKEVVAKTIHYNSNRRKKPFVAVNCAAIPGELIESELFGYSKGAFTGAAGEKKGKFEQADGGTIFLDEIGDMPMEAQSKLLRVLQDKVVEKLGGTKPVQVDVRILAATNKNLEAAVQSGEFRLDLYYRLNVFAIFLPPLRKRKEDIPEIAQHILKNLSKRYNKNYTISPEAVTALMNCNYPGNIRELENCLERSAFTAGGGEIKTKHISCMRGEMCMSHFMEEQLSGSSTAITPQTGGIPDNDYSEADNELISGNMDERERVVQALEKAGWVQAKAARMLDMTVRQMNYRIKKFNIKVKKI
ncbi:transcriptional regulator, NifA subfamily, Fis Family [Denitrovibrio acetiphilus DSM 12809]|uniref:Nif-specific regulatory protein n=1 Tax=Denitrovibrio acetiphilus (strain DSM 12809 / NBRC 114555 / N2460) TaxID=522772 RepID=D4H6U9_DENA2|nr:nif-specific transcriptional activator NifA [Denitrovibrio acetiphilus]ADD67815.1 transcriptional regulator, NifA subfamily, Fis Family [Denitrovibrio acetiphilus DSM 12809]